MSNKLFFPSLTLLALAALMGNVGAAVSFTEDFSSNTAGTNMALGTGAGTPITDFTGDFTVTSTTDGHRIYLGTNDTDYSTVDFVFQATVTLVAGGAGNISFFGMGTADAGTYYGEPLTGPNLLLLLAPNHNTSFRDNGLINGGGPQLPTAGAGTHLATMTWNSTTQSATFSWDQGNNGSVDQTLTMDGSDNGFTATNSQLLLGGGGEVTFDNISVSVPAVPEPSSTALLGLGGLALMLRRRR